MIGGRGFTLVELLVVIAIIAILAAILFPVFTAARKKAQLAACSGNMRQIALAFTMYGNDHNSCYPDQSSVMKLSDAYVGTAYTNAKGGAWIAAFAHRYLDNTGKYADGMAIPLKPYLKTLRVFKCPSEQQPKPGQTVWLPWIAGSSYYYKHALCYYSSYFKRPVRPADAIFASRCSIMYEEAWHGNYSDPRVLSDILEGPTKRMSAIFLDGHVGHIDVPAGSRAGEDHDANWYFLTSGESRFLGHHQRLSRLLHALFTRIVNNAWPDPGLGLESIIRASTIGACACH